MNELGLAWAEIPRVIAFAAGGTLVVGVLASAVRTLVLPRAVPDKIAFGVLNGVRRLFEWWARRASDFAGRDAVMAHFAPISVLLLLPVWLTLALGGFALMFWSLGTPSLGVAFRIAGSSLYTLGFAYSTAPGHLALEFAAATVGMVLVALLVAYLPGMYGAFQRRERHVSLLVVRAGAPPSGAEIIQRLGRIDGLERLDAIWSQWEVWFTDLEESHTTLAFLVFFRSPQPHASWITAAGAILDAAAIVQSAMAAHQSAQASLCIRAGYIALRRIADTFAIPYPADPRWPQTPVRVTREEFDEACAAIAAAGVPVNPDMDDAWRNFAGWRVNYDEVLIRLCHLTMAPPAPWSADRSVVEGAGRRGRSR